MNDPLSQTNNLASSVGMDGRTDGWTDRQRKQRSLPAEIEGGQVDQNAFFVLLVSPLK